MKTVGLMRKTRRGTDAAGSSLSPPRPTTWSVSATCWRRRMMIRKIYRRDAKPVPVHDPERAPADRADRLQPAVPLVRGPGAGRGGVQRHGVHQESGTAAHGRDRPALLRGGAGAGRVGGVGVLGALHGGRDADRGVGEPEELRAQGREAEGRRRPGQPDGQLPGREAAIPGRGSARNRGRFSGSAAVPEAGACRPCPYSARSLEAIRDWDLTEDPPLLLGNGDILEEVEIVEATTAAHHRRGEWILCQHDRQSRLLA